MLETRSLIGISSCQCSHLVCTRCFQTLSFGSDKILRHPALLLFPSQLHSLLNDPILWQHASVHTHMLDQTIIIVIHDHLLCMPRTSSQACGLRAAAEIAIIPMQASSCRSSQQDTPQPTQTGGRPPASPSRLLTSTVPTSSGPTTPETASPTAAALTNPLPPREASRPQKSVSLWSLSSYDGADPASSRSEDGEARHAPRPAQPPTQTPHLNLTLSSALPALGPAQARDCTSSEGKDAQHASHCVPLPRAGPDLPSTDCGSVPLDVNSSLGSNAGDAATELLISAGPRMVKGSAGQDRDGSPDLAGHQGSMGQLGQCTRRKLLGMLGWGFGWAGGLQLAGAAAPNHNASRRALSLLRAMARPHCLLC